MPITVRRTGKITIDENAAARALVQAVMKHMQSRVRAGVDARDRPFAPYSPLVQKQRAATGQPTDVELRSSGGLMNDLLLLRTEVRSGVITLTFGAGTGTSPQTPRPPPWVFIGTPEQQSKALDRWRNAAKKTTSSPPHDQLLALLVRGDGRRPPRDILGVSPRGTSEIVKAIESAPVFKS